MVPIPPPPDPPPPDPAPPLTGTPAALITAALHLFGRQGFAATTTRAIAARAGTNVASIAYHFGSKDGMRLACGGEIVRRLSRVLAVAADAPAPVTPAEAAARLERLVRAMAAFIATGSAAADLVAFLERELAEDGPVIARLYAAMFLPGHRALCALWGQATGRDPESAAVRLAVFSMLGQIIYFRIGRPMVLRRMGWNDIGPSEAAMLADRLAANLRAVLCAERAP